ncbi:alkaline phosphatase D family protein [Actinoplanes subglobosus]|uniref:Alkaline phosphatase D family protein n=1 Tax=Actinoplanes subglobosus TaxID=1547892 RepID=A0ABV8J5A0_9ACTN
MATRRDLLTVGSAALVTALTPAPARAAPPADPFTLGVASGDPLPEGVVLWTRLAPHPLEPTGGLPRADYQVRWQVAEDEGFTRVVKDGVTVAAAAYGHSVHVDVRGLRPAHDYFYRFRTDRHISPAGRTRTTPARTARPERLRFAIASCQNYTNGWFTALRHLAAEDLDVLFFLGDYIYEGAVDAVGGDRNDRSLRLPDTFELAADTLDLYRMRYALYRTDPDLQAAHAAVPWALTWDDHEVEDDYAAAVPRGGGPPADFLVHRANAYRAYWENQPLRRPRQPAGPDMPLHRRLCFGDLAHAYVLDTRQYRTDQACDGRMVSVCAQRDEPGRTLLGPGQRTWLLNGMAHGGARWNLLAQQVMMAECRYGGAAGRLDMDKWDGYPADRAAILGAAARVPGTVVLTGDIHFNYAADLRTDFSRPDLPPVGVELVGTSLTSGGDGADVVPKLQQQQRYSPHLRFTNGQRGYVRCELTRDMLRADFRVLPHVTRPGSPITTRASFVSERARPGLVAA